MADVISRPDGFDTYGDWLGAYTDVDDAVVAPGSPDASQMSINTNGGTSAAILTLEDPAIHSNNIVVWVYGRGDDSEGSGKDEAGFTLTITIGAKTYAAAGSSTSGNAWISTPLTDVWTPSDFATAFKVQFNAFDGEKDNDFAAIGAVQLHVTERVFVVNVLGGNIDGGNIGVG